MFGMGVQTRAYGPHLVTSVESFGRFTRLTVGVTLALAAAGAALTWVYDPAAAKGLFAGGAAGAGGFWFTANRAAKLASIPPDQLTYRVYRWTFMRMGLYGLVLAWAYTVDREGRHALVAAVFGLLIVRVAMVILGLTVARVRTDGKTSTPHD